MKVNVRGKNKFEISNAIRDYATTEVGKLERLFKKDEEVIANVLCKDYNTHKTAEITIPTKHMILRAEVNAPTIYSAIVLAVEKIETQIKKHKSKIYSSLKKREGLAAHFSTDTDFDIEQMKSEVNAINLVRSKTVDLQPMTPEEAITQMEMLGHDFFIFLNVETDKVCVVYIREDMDYGIIEANN